MDFNRKLDDLIRRASGWIQDPDSDQPTAHFVANHFTLRGIRICQDIQVLAAAGSARNAWALFRMLVDRQLLLHYLLAREEFDQFQNWSLACRYHDLEALAKTGNLSGDDQANTAETIRAIRVFFGGKPERPRHYWRKPKPQQMFLDHSSDKTAAQAGYLKLYQITSGLVHPAHDDFREDGYAQETLIRNTYLALISLMSYGFLAVRRDDLFELLIREQAEVLGVLLPAFHDAT